ncbi:MAG: AmmeMemoRadiSam system radical SAM enzyme [Spirochaetota bacterium]|nr:MAG: AmmeMemoRadiSam system radical SAM enzyme [Spirochaetota bacterium]
MEKEALFYTKGKENRVQCELCPNNCSIGIGKVGICGVRKNVNGKLITLIYGEASSVAMDPIEKKPLYHFFPGSSILSVGTVGCSFKCGFCQNYHISQNPRYPTDYYAPEDIVSLAKRNGSVGIAYTYSEPLIWYEWVIDTCRLARKAGMKNVFVTNGYINQDPLKDLLEFSDAFNIDLKSFNEDFYKKIAGGKLKAVLETIEEISKRKEIVLEVTTLVIPGYNDSEEEMERLTDWLSGLGKDIPYHLSAYYPMYTFKAPPTQVSTLQRLKKIAEKRLHYVYLGNVSGDSSSYCANCNSVLVQRFGYSIKVKNYSNGKCTSCGHAVPIKG